jgi:hypothetical protein
VLIGAGVLSACTPPEPSPFARIEGVGIGIFLPDAGAASLSIFPIKDVVIDQIALKSNVASNKQGDYYPDSPSPPFQQLNAEDVVKNYQNAHGDTIQSLINCSFFERYDAVTELSFPIKRAGAIVTGGSSPYGPRANPADKRYSKVVLRALVWNDTQVKITNYDHRIGSPLNDAAFFDGLVTYRYVDHPAYVLMGDLEGQYQMLGVRGDHTLLVLTITRGRMEDGADVLRTYGAEGDILTIDGGPSTHLWTKFQETVIATKSVALPHYLGFRSRA